MRSDGRQPTPGDTQKIASIFRGATTPLYLGFASIESGLPLSKAQLAADELLASGIIRRLTPKELDAGDHRPDAEVYVAVR